jgi:hypothetical protein
MRLRRRSCVAADGYPEVRCPRGTVLKQQPESDRQRRQRQLDRLAFEVLAARHTGPESWMRWTDWFELTKAKQGDLGLGPATFSDCIRRLLKQGRIRKSQIAKNRFYQAIFTSGSSPEVNLPKSDCQESSVVLDVAAQALEQLKRKPPGVV